MQVFWVSTMLRIVWIVKACASRRSHRSATLFLRLSPMFDPHARARRPPFDFSSVCIEGIFVNL